MAPLLRGRFVCFYCGCRSAQTKQPNIKQWKCEKCEAVNHLDENGEITDPPAVDESSNARYAQSIQRPTSPVFDVPEESLFCKTCLQNQLMLSQNLASYFPAQDVPNYSDYEKQYPKYRKELEVRYPQVCEECEPRVRERIKATGYAAKTDHLRRLMDRTMGGGIARGERGWKTLLVFIGGTAWGLSLVGQFAWDGLSLLSNEQDNGGLIDEDASNSGLEFLRQVAQGSAILPHCTMLVDPMAPYALLLGVLSCWWNPRLRERLTRVGGRFIGLPEYYKLQAILLFARILVWTYVAGISSSEPLPQTTKGIHGALLFFGILITVMSFRAVGLDYSPRVIFQDSPEPLMPRKSQSIVGDIGSEKPGSFIHRPSAYPAQRSSSVRPFSINDLAPVSGRQPLNSYQSPYQPPTPPPEEDDDSAMDWTPSQQGTFRPAALCRPPSSSFQPTQQTPFRGHLPADVVSMEHRLRNPPNKPTFRKAAETTKQNFFRALKTVPHRDYDTTSDTATDYEPSLAGDTPVAARFAEPKLWLPSTQSADTGLERLLANTFSLEDEPQEVQALVQQQALGTRPFSRYTLGNWYRYPLMMLLATSSVVWTKIDNPSLSACQPQARLATLLLTAIISTKSLILVLRKDFADWIGSDLMISSSELLVSGFLAFATGQFAGNSLMTTNQESIERTGATLMFIMAVQEMWMAFLDLRTPLDSLPAPASEIELPPTTDFPPAKSPPSHHLPANEEASQIATLPPSRTIQPSRIPAQRSTRSMTKDNRNAVVSTGLGGLSLGGNQNSPLSGQLDGMGSLSLRTPRTSNRGGMW